MRWWTPGPRSWALARDQRDGLDTMLDATDVLLLTQARSELDDCKPSAEPLLCVGDGVAKT